MRIVMLHDVFRSEVFGLGGVNHVAAFWQAMLAPRLARLGHRLEQPPRWRDDRPPGLVDLAARLGLAAEPASWARLFSDPALLAAVRAELSALRGADLVLGWELSPNILRALAGLGVAVIDAGIDAIRFCDDLFLRLRSNSPRHAGTLAALAVPERALREAAARLLAAPADIDAAALFVGQMPIDASLIAGARLARPADFAAPLAALADRLLLKAHPHAAPNTALRALHAALPGSRIAPDPIYALLAAPALGEVITLSSSVAEEAAYFGKPARCLIAPDAAPAAMPEYSPFHRIDAGFMTAGFWDRLLSNRPARPISPTAPERSLRQIFSYDWGWAARPPRPRQRRLAPGLSVSFAAGCAGLDWLGFGWSGAEDWGVWTDGDLATLLLRPDAAPDGLVLRLDAIAHLPDRSRPPRLHIASRPSGIDLRVRLDAPRLDLAITLPPALCGAGLVEIVLRFADLTSPQLAGTSDDPRLLGLGVLAASVI